MIAGEGLRGAPISGCNAGGHHFPQFEVTLPAGVAIDSVHTGTNWGLGESPQSIGPLTVPGLYHFELSADDEEFNQIRASLTFEVKGEPPTVLALQAIVDTVGAGVAFNYPEADAVGHIDVYTDASQPVYIAWNTANAQFESSILTETFSDGPPVLTYSDSSGFMRIDLGGPGTDQTYTLTATGANDASHEVDLTVHVDDAPTPVTGLAGIEAIGRETRIEIRWAVRSRRDYLGFHVLRSEAGSSFTRQTEAMVPNDAPDFPAILAWLDENVEDGVEYAYRIEMILTDGTSVVWPETITSQTLDRLPIAYALRIAGPNPFRAREGLVFEYDVPRAGTTVKIAVYDAAGRSVATLVDGPVGAGTRSDSWQNEELDGLASGIYFVHMEAADFRATKRLVLMD